MQGIGPVKVRAVVRAGLLESVFSTEEIDFEYVDADAYDGDADADAVIAEYSLLPIEVM